jgi:hypothetical protein
LYGEPTPEAFGLCGPQFEELIVFLEKTTGRRLPDGPSAAGAGAFGGSIGLWSDILALMANRPAPSPPSTPLSTWPPSHPAGTKGPIKYYRKLKKELADGRARVWEPFPTNVTA